MATKEKESRDIEEKTAALLALAQSKCLVLQGRQAFSKKLDILFPPIAAGIGAAGIAAGGYQALFSLSPKVAVTAVTVFKGAAIAGPPLLIAAFNPVGAIILAALISGVAIARLVKSVWDSHNTKAIGLVERLVHQLNSLTKANASFFSSTKASKSPIRVVTQSALDLKVKADVIKLCVTSQKQRKANTGVCTRAEAAVTTMIYALEKIKAIDTQLLEGENL